MLKVDYDICSGCGACRQVCPANAICMQNDIEGFSYPVVDEKKCIDCQICEQICPQKKNYTMENEPIYYAGRNKNCEVVRSSSSGGLFDALARMTFDKAGIVYAVGMDDSFTVRYYRIDKYSEIDRLRGSKYVEANISEDMVESLFEDISNRLNILFVGTSCMISGIVEACQWKKLDTSNVLFCDFFYCSGNASPILWKDEVKSLSGKSEIKDISFRNKKNGWRNYCFEILYLDKKKKRVNSINSSWGRMFGITSAVRQNCNNCRYNNFVKKSDISLGDFWNSYAIPKEWKDNKGVTLVAVNSIKAQKIINDIEQYASMKVVDKDVINWCHKKNEVSDLKLQRKEFWEYYRNYGYEKLQDKYCRVTIKDIIAVSVIRNILIKTRLMEVLDKNR